MNPTPKFEAHVVEKKMKMLDRERVALARWISTFKNGAKLELVVRKWKEKRTDPQRKYYFGVVVPILGNHFGYESEEMHEELKIMFNPKKSKIDPSRTIGGSTTKMSTVEFYSDDNSYVERICRWAATEHSIFIPPPEKMDG